MSQSTAQQTQSAQGHPAQATPEVTSAAPASRPAARGRLAAIWSAAQFLAALAVTIGALVYLLSGPPAKPDAPPENAEPHSEPVQVVGPFLIRIEPDTPLAKKLQVVEVEPTQLTAPSLLVTGTVVASLRPGSGLNGNEGWKALVPWNSHLSDYWQFNSPEVLSAFSDWQKAKADAVFARAQFVRIRDAALARTSAQRDVVATMVKLEAAGTETKKALALEQATLRQYEIQEQKEIYEAETAIRVAERAEATAARQLQQAGLDPALFGSITSDMDLVMADVPEGFLSRVKVGDGCEARFFGIPEQTFRGRVKSIAPVVTRERRSLRVLFTVDDLKDQLRPGMFAEIGLGTDPRRALLVPAEGVVHVGRHDYVLVATPDANVWRASTVEVGEARAGRLEILTGVHPGDRVLGQGAILLKPALTKAVQPGKGD